MEHADDEPVMYGYASNRNITMQGTDETGYTWGEWRAMSKKQQDAITDEIVWDLVEVYILDDETEGGEE